MRKLFNLKGIITLLTATLLAFAFVACEDVTTQSEGKKDVDPVVITVSDDYQLDEMVKFAMDGI